MGWDHGYYSHSTYTSAFFRELAPSWLDFAALIKGHCPPRGEEGQPFRYLELGCGMGFGLCVLAALHPEGTFVGIDFNPSHISHAEGLSRRLALTNVRFLEADFLALAEDPSPLGPGPEFGGGFHYVAAHGIATWVRETVQQALFFVASAALRPAGLFYCSYNTLPGWLGRTTFQQLYELERGRSDPAEPKVPLRRAIAGLKALLGTVDQPTALRHAIPQLEEDLAGLDPEQFDYLCGEFANEGWQPLYVADLHRRCMSHKLHPLGTATLPEAFDQLLAPSIQGPIFAEANSLIRQTMIDLATNKSFRRDVFVKGLDPLTLQDAEMRIGGLGLRPLHLPSAPSEGPPSFSFGTSFGQVHGDPDVYGPIVERLASRGCTVFELQQHSGQSAAELLMVLSLFLNAGWIGFDRSRQAGAGKLITQCQRCNGVLMELIAGGRPYASLLLPEVGTALPVSLVDVLIHKAMDQGLQEPMLSTCVLMGLDQMGVHLLAADKSPITDPEAKLSRLQALIGDFREYRLPILWRLGGLPSPKERQPRSAQRRSRAPAPK
ncbi:SAM-dependent methyltransferase [Cyanobium sp. Copco_Reservoir_LC18]|uniref:class I SAM-dependent methyltransferase n=1 Tax=Cyanobium sp. Copco_Reservoir_LC18 TaxID=1328305 RepID=UPI001357B207|nr:methyltransferase regulatory domain-containing protein [Cyanobium sp. Copco_Reservoir_LC18]KAF0652412.1 SAM-dependent methyltransferase [Cyanobium sp. Copco_Reservoir_LC18]